MGWWGGGVSVRTRHGAPAGPAPDLQLEMARPLEVATPPGLPLRRAPRDGQQVLNQELALPRGLVLR